MSKSKEFRIGEYAVGGIIVAEISHQGLILKIEVRQFNDNSLVKSKLFDLGLFCSFVPIREYLEDLTTPYYEDIICKWIKENRNTFPEEEHQSLILKPLSHE